MMKFKKGLSLIIIITFLYQNVAFSISEKDSALRPPSHFSKSTKAFIETQNENDADENLALYEGVEDGKKDSIVKRISTIFYLPFITKSDIEKITLEIIDDVIKDDLNIDFTRPAVNVHIRQIVRAGLRVGKTKEEIVVDIQDYVSYFFREIKETSKRVSTSELKTLSTIESELRRRFGRTLPKEVYLRTSHTPGTINEHCYEPFGDKIFLDSRNMDYPWAIFEETIHSISAGLPSYVLDEGYTNILVQRAANEKIFDGPYYDIVHYPLMQRVVNQLIQEIGEEGFALAYFTGDERYISNSLGDNGELVLSLLYALDDFWIGTFGMFEVDTEEIVRLILGNRNIEENLRLIGEILILRYKYWKKGEYDEENRTAILEETERIKSLFVSKDKIGDSRPSTDWSIFESELKNILVESKNPFLIDLIKGTLREQSTLDAIKENVDNRDISGSV
ncbi:MAG: hypothetical protein KJ706_06110 [Candidatus Omnitrophica bacterium]|nr:hypothetical protein [Candidatus Omnitrophota bacterium]